MEKLTKELYIKHAKRLASIVNATSPFAQYLNRTDFINILKLEINVLASLETKFPDDKLDAGLKASKIAADFASLSKTEYKLDEKFKYEDEDDYIDAINYLHTYCKNIYKVDIDELVEGKKVDVAAPDINLGADAHEDAAGAAAMGGMPFMGAMGDMAGMPGMEGMVNPFAYANATARLNKEVKEGKVYQYTSKPKAVPIMKTILSVLLILIAVAFILSSVFAFITNGLAYDYEGKAKTANFVTNGVFYLITAGFAIYVAVTNIIQEVQGKKNDNIKYSFTWFLYFGLLLLVFLIPLLDLRNTWIIKDVTITDTTFRKTVGLAGWKILLLIDVALGLLLLIPLIIGAVKAPKVNQEMLQNLISEYMKGFMPKQTPSTNNVDVQKPVDVKPTEEKKPEDNKPDESLKS